MSSNENKDQLTSEKEDLLALLLAEEEFSSEIPESRLLKVDRNGPVPLSFTQERLWFLEQLQPGSALYNFHASLALNGVLDIQALKSSLLDVIQRHEVLRTSFCQVDGTPVQKISADPELDLVEIDLSGESDAMRETKILALSEEQAGMPFDIETGPLLRLVLIKVASELHQLLITTHHIITDGWGMSIFFRDLAEFYKSRVKGEEPALESLHYQYADIAYTQRHEMDDSRQSALLDYWKSRLGGSIEPLDLPGDRPRPDVQAIDGGKILFELSEQQTNKLREFGRENHFTSFMILLSVFYVLLYRYTGRTDLIVGTPAAERNRIEMENLVGVFVNNLVLRTDLSGDPDFITLLRRVSETSLEAFDHQALPFERLVSELNLPRDRSRSPLFQVMFVYQNAPAVELDMEGLSIVPTEYHSGASEYDLSLYIRDRQESQTLECWFEYSTALFNPATVDRIKSHFVNLLDHLLDSPGASIYHAEMLLDEEKNWLLGELNPSASQLPSFAFTSEISRQAKLNPEKIAVVCEYEELTYSDLESRSNKLANFLISRGIVPGTKIGVLLDRDEYLMVGLLGTLKSGAAYIPIDPGFPASRIAYMCQHSATPVILATQPLLDCVADTDAEIICLDLDWADIDNESSSSPGITVSLDQPAYVIYTSGSTGQPKGVEVTHANVINFLRAMSKRPGFLDTDSLLAVTTISFDIHVLELFLPLFCGGRLVVASRETTHDGFQLFERLKAGDITMMQATPATWQMLIHSGWVESLDITALCGGEKLSRELADELLDRVGCLWNMYGPTETTVWSAVSRIHKDGKIITIGEPIDNTQLYITDSSFEPLPVGVPGELIIGGSGVTKGYLGRPDLTEEKFISRPSPLGSFDDNGKLYLTGDQARYRGNGQIEVLGRMDNQIKLRGYRIETGEIEKTLVKNDAIREAVVQLREDRPGDQRLVAYLLANTEKLQAGSVRDWLEKYLPDYMVPSAFVWMDSFPMTPNNKVDRKALPQPEQEDSERGSEYGEPQTEMEKILVEIFQNVLDVSRVGRFDNFFDLGGHSLLSMKVVSRFEKETGLRMQPAELFQQTIGQIAAFHEKQEKPGKPTESGGLRNRLRGALRSFTE